MDETNEFLQTPIGKIDEVLGPINQVYFTVKPQEGIVATSFKPGDKVFIGGDKLLPLEKYAMPLCFFFFFFCSKSQQLTNPLRFLPKPKPPPGTNPYLMRFILRPYLTHFQVLRSRREVASASLAPVVVLVVDEVRLAAVPEAARPVDAEDLEEAVALAVAVVVALVVASRVEEAAAEAVEALVVDSRQSLSCLQLSYFGVWGNRELLQEPLCLYTLVHTTTREKCCLSFCEGCRTTGPLMLYTIQFLLLVLHTPG